MKLLDYLGGYTDGEKRVDISASRSHIKEVEHMWHGEAREKSNID